MASAAERVYDLIKETVEAQGVTLWDVRFLKEGASWYLRVFIDKEGGINIDDCTNVSHAIDPIIDEADPIDKSYYLEVCSCGVDRELTRPAHYEAMQGETVKIKLYKALDGVKEFIGVLSGFDGNVKLDVDGTVYEFTLKEISKANVYYFE
ncbi:MAG: ribosome maturation factor RimP [Clostridia bacterium]|nr:ribosome maturation factor RimP [Clostridia bacterium]